MQKILITAALAAGLLASIPAMADSVVVEDAWIRATAPGQDNGALRFTITSPKAGKVTAVSTPVAASVEIHTMTREGGKMKMRAIDAVALPADTAVDLGAGGNHIMLIGLKQPMKAGDSVPFTVTLQIGDGGKETVEAKAEVRPVGGESGGHGGHGMHHGH
ncbi:MAG: copper chaperone PCu(A)C [Gallionellaceae bacterium]|nr:copper chaperone PCu(A)C [Gallionellaceae bacterium]